MSASSASSTDPDNALSAVPTDVVASLNTHDTATFMGFWQGDEIDDRVALGLVDVPTSRAGTALSQRPSEMR